MSVERVVSVDRARQLRVIASQSNAIEERLSKSNQNEWIYESDASFKQTNRLISETKTILADTAELSLLPDLLTVGGGAAVRAGSIHSTISSLLAIVKEFAEPDPNSESQFQEEIKALRLQLAEAESRPLALVDDELRDRCTDLLFRPGKADTAVRDALVVLEHRIRSAAELGDEFYGVGLVDKALAPKTGVLVMRGTEPEREGAHQLFRGMIGTFKNPTSHRIVVDYDATRARQVVGFVDLLLQLLRGAELKRSVLKGDARPTA